MTFPTKVPSDSLGWIGSLKRTSDKSLFPMALGSCGHRITHQLRPINMNGRSILAVTSIPVLIARFLKFPPWLAVTLADGFDPGRYSSHLARIVHDGVGRCRAVPGAIDPTAASSGHRSGRGPEGRSQSPGPMGRSDSLAIDTRARSGVNAAGWQCDRGGPRPRAGWPKSGGVASSAAEPIPPRRVEGPTAGPRDRLHPK